MTRLQLPRFPGVSGVSPGQLAAVDLAELAGGRGVTLT